MSAQQRLDQVTRICPRAFELAELLVSMKQSGEIIWPDYCFLPISGWIEVAGAEHEGESRLSSAYRASQIAAPATWRYTQGVYEFDADLYTELMDAELSGKLPSEALLRLPEWCVYIKTPLLEDSRSEIDGFFAMLEYDVERERAELRFYLDRAHGGELEPVIMHLGPWTIDESLQRMAEESVGNLRKQGLDARMDEATADFEIMNAMAKRLLPLVLYLCTEEPEVENLSTPDWLPHNPQPKRVRGQFRLMPARKSHHYMLGRKVGENLRKARREAYEHEATGRTVAPHIRKAHWHGYWTGPRKGPQSVNQKFVLKWLPPIVVLGSQA